MKIESIEDAKKYLDRIDELEAKRTFLRLQRDQLIASILTEGQLAQMKEYEADFEKQSKELDTKVQNLQNLLKPYIKKNAATIQGQYYQGVFRKGYLKYDTKKLDEYLDSLGDDHEDLVAAIRGFRGETAASVSFKAVAR